MVLQSSWTALQGLRTMDMKNVKYVIAVGANSWGGGKTIDEATKNLKKQDGRIKKEHMRAFWFFDCERSEISIQCGVDLMLGWPETATVMRLDLKQEE
jgi:hypothetical protein